jgi:hypothetical protein
LIKQILKTNVTKSKGHTTAHSFWQLVPVAPLLCKLIGLFGHIVEFGGRDFTARGAGRGSRKKAQKQHQMKRTGKALALRKRLGAMASRAGFALDLLISRKSIQNNSQNDNEKPINQRPGGRSVFAFGLCWASHSPASFTSRAPKPA